MKTYLLPLFLSVSMLLSVNVFAQRPDVIELPAPQMTGGMPLFDAISARQSTRDYSDKEVPLQKLSTILWAAYGFNRPDMRVIPTASNRQHLSVYVFLNDAVYFYDAAENKLFKRADGDHRRIIGGQEFVYVAPVNLLFVADGTRGGGTGTHISVGCIVQNVYLASAALGLGSVVRGSGINAEAIRPLLNLADTDELIIAQTVGYANEGETTVQANPAAQERRAGDRMELTINGIEYAFRWCPPGTFMMGSPASEERRFANEAQHQVTFTRGFWMLETEVTQAMWESVMGSNPSHFRGEKLPVEMVSWNDCQEYIQKLNDLGVAPAGFRFSLPTEAQWEYACRAGTTTAYHFGDTLNQDQANFGGQQSKEVGSFPANAWGLRDMHGNVWEWCLDWFGNYPDDAVTDPTGVSSGTHRVIRGGGWSHNVVGCRSAFRSSRDEPANRRDHVGFRLALVHAE